MHIYIWKDDGKVYTWGDNGYGQIGNGNYKNQHAPVQVASEYDIVDIAAGGYHCMALTGNTLMITTNS